MNTTHEDLSALFVRLIWLGLEGQLRFAEMLLSPPEPTEALIRAFQRRRELMGSTK